MKNSLYLLAVSAVTFTLGVAIATYSITSGPGGTAKVNVGSFNLELHINDVDFDKLFADERYDDEAQLKAKDAFDLYELES